VDSCEASEGSSLRFDLLAAGSSTRCCFLFLFQHSFNCHRQLTDRAASTTLCKEIQFSSTCSTTDIHNIPKTIKLTVILNHRNRMNKNSLTREFYFTSTAVRYSGSMLVSINIAALHRVKLVLRWATFAGCLCTILVCNQPPSQIQPGHPPGDGKMSTSDSWESLQTDAKQCDTTAQTS